MSDSSCEEVRLGYFSASAVSMLAHSTGIYNACQLSVLEEAVPSSPEQFRRLMSGGYDLFVVVEGRTMKEVALFVAEKLAPIESVISTSTHFVLRKYKDHGVQFGQQRRDEREAVVL